MGESPSRDVLLGHDSATGQPVTLPYAGRDRGLAIIGKSGSGKSSLLERLILADLASGTPGIVIDPHGRLAANVISEATSEEAERIILLEVMKTQPFGLNLLDVRAAIDEDDDPTPWAADMVIETIKTLYGEDDEFLPRLEYYLDLASRTLIPSGLTLLDALRLFRDETFRRACLRRVEDRDEHERLRFRWLEYEKLRPVERVRHIEALVNRLERLFAPVAIQGVVGSRTTTVPFEAILSGNCMLIVSLPSERLSTERCNFIASLLLSSLADRIFARSVSHTTPPRVHIYLDEYQRFATSTTADLFEEGRKYNVGVTVAHQSLYQIEHPRIRNAARHAAALIVLEVADPDAQLLAGEFPIRPRAEWLERIEEQDGLESELVFSPTPGQDILMRAHSNPAVWEGANRILTSAGRDQPVPHPARIVTDSRLLAPPGSFDGLLTDAMSGKRLNPTELAWHLLTVKIGWQPADPMMFYEGSLLEYTERVRADTPTRYIVDGCTEWAKVPTIDSQRGEQWHNLRTYSPPRRVAIRHPRERRPYGQYNPFYEDHHAAYWNQQLDQLWHRDVRECFERLSEWFEVHLARPDALGCEQRPPQFHATDERFVAYALEHHWSGSRCHEGEKRLIWHGQDARSEQRDGTHAQRLQDALDLIRLQVGTWHRWLALMIDGLVRDPILVPTSNHRPRMRTHHILHSQQTVGDARTEFANLLANAPESFIAQCKIGSRSHAVKLLEPPNWTFNGQQLAEVRQRSRGAWALPERAPDLEPDEERMRPARRTPQVRITRWPTEYTKTEGESDDDG